MSFPVCLVLGLSLLLPLAAGAREAVHEVPDWEEVGDVDTVRVVTRNEDGTRLDNTVWLVVVNEQGYIRTGGSRWGENVKRDPNVELRIGDDAYAIGALFVEDEGLREEIHDAFREKYGWTDAIVSLFRGSDVLVMRLTSR